MKTWYKSFSRNISDTSAALRSMLSVLWYSNLPCFDVEGVTSEFQGEKSTIKACWWKGKPMSCSAIFQKVATDNGICCGFNKPEADKIFVDSTYAAAIRDLAVEEKRKSFSNSTLPSWFKSNNEPKSQAGTDMGLTVLLDSHTDLISEFSVSSDFLGFSASVSGSTDFPLMHLNEFKVTPGHTNMVALSASKLEADDSIRSIQPLQRNCYFDDETEQVRLHKKYSQSNCLLECSLAFAQRLFAEKNQVIACTPWFFPFENGNHRMCDPWEKSEIMAIIKDEIPDDVCLQCLPDCNRIIYQKSMSVQPFRICDEKNFGMSRLCSLENVELNPQIWGKQVLEQLSGSRYNLTKLKASVKSSQRFLKMVTLDKNVFTNISRTYDAFQNDISMLNVFFDSPTALKYSTKVSKTWFDFVAAVGGNGGLFIGFSLVTILEVICLCQRMVAASIKG